MGEEEFIITLMLIGLCSILVLSSVKLKTNTGERRDKDEGTKEI
jgi:hypothetical protein